MGINTKIKLNIFEMLVLIFITSLAVVSFIFILLIACGVLSINGYGIPAAVLIGISFSTLIIYGGSKFVNLIIDRFSNKDNQIISNSSSSNQQQVVIDQSRRFPSTMTNSIYDVDGETVSDISNNDSFNEENRNDFEFINKTKDNIKSISMAKTIKKFNSPIVSVSGSAEIINTSGNDALNDLKEFNDSNLKIEKLMEWENK